MTCKVLSRCDPGWWLAPRCVGQAITDTSVQGTDIWRPGIPSPQPLLPFPLLLYFLSSRSPFLHPGRRAACQFHGWSKRNNILLFSFQCGNSTSLQFPSGRGCTEGPLRLLMGRGRGVERGKEWESLLVGFLQARLDEIFPSHHQSPWWVMATVRMWFFFLSRPTAKECFIESKYTSIVIFSQPFFLFACPNTTLSGLVRKALLELRLRLFCKESPKGSQFGSIHIYSASGTMLGPRGELKTPHCCWKQWNL